MHSLMFWISLSFGIFATMYFGTLLIINWCKGKLSTMGKIIFCSTTIITIIVINGFWLTTN